jgi:hypothetical protein
MFNYFGVSPGFLPVEAVSFRTDYTMDISSEHYYVDDQGNIDLGSLISDILSGKDSPTTQTGYLFMNVVGSQRIGAMMTALLEARKYRDYYDWKN